MSDDKNKPTATTEEQRAERERKIFREEQRKIREKIKQKNKK